jgi:hypothetical protein
MGRGGRGKGGGDGSKGLTTLGRAKEEEEEAGVNDH